MGFNENNNHPLTNDTYDWNETPKLVTITLTQDDVSLLKYTLAYSAFISRQNEHYDQAEMFHELREKINEQTDGI